MHVCIVSDVFYPIIEGDVVRILKDALVIKETGNSVSIVSPYEGIETINCYKINSRGSSLFSFTYAVWKIHQKSTIDIIWINRYFLILPFFILSKIIGAKFVCEIHGPERKQTEYFSKSRKKIVYDIIYFIDELLLKFIDKIVVVERELAEWLQKDLYVSKNKIIFIGNYPDLSIFSPVKKKRGGNFIVGFLGSLIKGRIDPLLELVAKNKKGYSYIVIGDGEDKEKVLSFKNIIHLVENDYQKVHLHLKRLDLGIIFSLSTNVVFPEKGPPMKLFEYLACGVPVIAVNMPNLRPFIENNGVGLVVGKGELDQGIAKIRNNYSWYKKRTLKFRSKMLKCYSWKKEKKKILYLLNNFSYL